MVQLERPLSPHLQVYRPQLTSVLSILHRITGVILGAGMLLITWWLVAAAYGPQYFELARLVVTSGFGRFILLGFTYCLFYHLCNGIRHLFWDAGFGFELKTAYASGWTVVIVSIMLTIGSWIAGYPLESL